MAQTITTDHPAAGKACGGGSGSRGRATLLVQAGEALDPKTQKFIKIPLPYGPKARLLLMHLNTEAVRRQSPVIPVEDSMTAFFRRLMGRTLDGRQIRMLKDRLQPLRPRL